MTHNLWGVRVEEYAYDVNKLRQNVGLETWIWRQIVTSQMAHTKYKWPPYENFLRTPLIKMDSITTLFILWFAHIAKLCVWYMRKEPAKHW